MKTDEIRLKFLQYFEKKGHKIVSSDSLIPHNDPTLLFTGAGMNQFKEYFLGIKKDFTRAASSQKCLRTGDLDNVGRTAYHHSFFEMLGNFSFGDYFKPEAITWAWEFMTKELGIDSERLFISVHNDDDESYNIWNKDIGLPENKIYRFGDKDNFWPSNAPKDGPNGPCGPCSEIFYDQGADYGCGRKECSPECDCGRFAEIWNLVFTQYERKDGGVIEPLPTKNIDTGMGLERIACVMQGRKNNYEIDIFRPLIDVIVTESTVSVNDFDKARSSIYAIADHMRAIVFAMSDGAYPSNEGRGYVIRKLLRRSVWHGHLIGIKKSFLAKLIQPIVDTFKEAYPELEEHSHQIREIINREEDRFLNTLQDGLDLLKGLIGEAKSSNRTELKGEDVFKLYDTYGFPDELTRLISQKEGLTIDEKGFENEMDIQRERAKQANKISDDIFVTSELEKWLSKQPKTKFCGYEQSELNSKVISLFCQDKECDEYSGENYECIAVLDMTPFYAESGGQVGDSGTMKCGGSIIKVLNTFKKNDVYYHLVKIEKGHIAKGDVVNVSIDYKRRENIMKNHTATHLLQAALREVLGKHVRQLGSMVSDEKLRFDFYYQKALSESQKIKIEKLVNDKIKEELDLNVKVTSVDDAKNEGALAFFGDRYGDSVRMVSIGDFSKELCGGTHLDNTKQIGVFKIVSESSIASGIRRIEAVTNEKAMEFIESIKLKDAQLKSKQEEKKIAKEERSKKLKKIKAKENIDRILKLSQKIGNYNLISQSFNDIDQGGLREIYDELKTKISHSIVALFSDFDNKLTVLVALSRDLANSQISAGEIIKDLNKIISGQGGGKKQMAFSGSKNVEMLEEAIKKLPSIIEKQYVN